MRRENQPIRIEELSIVSMSLFVRYQPIRFQHFLKKLVTIFKENLNQYLENVFQKTFEVTLQEKRKKPQMIFLLMKEILTVIFFIIFERFYCTK